MIRFSKYCRKISANELNISEPDYWPQTVGEDIIKNKNAQ